MKTTAWRNKNTTPEVSSLLPCTSKPLSEGLQGDLVQQALLSSPPINHQENKDISGQHLGQERAPFLKPALRYCRTVLEQLMTPVSIFTSLSVLASRKEFWDPSRLFLIQRRTITLHFPQPNLKWGKLKCHSKMVTDLVYPDHILIQYQSTP